jgi:ABC-type transport system involved in cytochrome c biogenesis ATPase subunit
MFECWVRHEELTKMGKEKHERINKLMHTQLAYGGYRLAATLNAIFAY